MQTKTKREWIAFRYVFAIMGCLGIASLFSMRVTLSIAVVAMVNSNTENGEKVNQSVAYNNLFNTSEMGNETSSLWFNTSENYKQSEEAEQFNWDDTTQGLVLGAFYWGYIISQIPGGRVAELLSGKWVFGFCVLCSSLLYLLIPVAARFSYWCVIVIRILQGLVEGPAFPTVQTLLANWAPNDERSKISTILLSGSTLGTMGILPLTGYLIESGFLGGWPCLYYICGMMGVIWFIFWSFLVYDNVDKHPWISPKEKEYVRANVPILSKKRPKLPLKEMLTSLPLWAITVSHFCHNWGGYTMMSDLPTFMHDILHFDIKKNSQLVALPNFTSWLMCLFCSYLCDYLIQREIISRTVARKSFNFAGHALPAVVFIALTFVPQDEVIIVVLLVLAQTLSGAAYAGFLCNHIDIAPYFAGTLMGITNSAGSLPGFLGPLVVGTLTNEDQSFQQWCYVFYITAAFYLFSAIFYAIFGKAEEQPWSKKGIPKGDFAILRRISSYHPF